RSTDWHLVAKQVAFGNGSTVDIRELSYEVSSSESVTDVDSHTQRRVKEQKPLAATEVVPTESELEESQIGLLEVFHRSGADRSKVPDFFRRDHRVYFELNMEDAALRAAVIAAAGRIPFTSFEARSTTAASAIETMEPPSYSTYPPFIEDL